MEADQLTVELGQKNDLLKKFSTKCTTLEIELVQAQALSGHTDESAEPEVGENGSGQNLAVPSPQTKKGVSGKLKSFFANKFKKNTKGNDNNSATNSNRASDVGNAVINVQNQDENAE